MPRKPQSAEQISAFARTGVCQPSLQRENEGILDGYDSMLKTNTVKRRVHSLFCQGCMLYDLIPNMPEARLRPLMERFAQMLHEQPLFADVFGPM